MRRLVVAIVSVVVVASSVAPVAKAASVQSTTATFDGTWQEVRSAKAHGKSLVQSSLPGSVVIYTVRSRAFSVWYLAGPDRGIASIYVNGQPVRVVDQWATSPTRRSVALTGRQPVNTVMVAATGEKRPRSRGALVNVDAVSPLPSKCAKGCQRSPVPVLALASLADVAPETAWFPEAVPAPESPHVNLAVGSYVRGSDALPLAERAAAISASACNQARLAPRGTVVLSFGKQVEGGASGFGTTIVEADIVAITATVAAGLAECGSGPWEVSVGTSNSGGATPFNGVDGGARWAAIVEQARAASDPRVAISGAVDLEPSWGPVAQARAWVAGYVAATSRRLWNFGSADGCPLSVGGVRCNNGWTIDDVAWVSTEAGPNVWVAPQIFTQSGSLARQWAVIAARTLQRGVQLRIGGVGVQASACVQRGPCGTTGNQGWQAWQQMRSALDAIPATAGMPIGAPRDIRWGF
jgi:hypothetical protein